MIINIEFLEADAKLVQHGRRWLANVGNILISVKLSTNCPANMGPAVPYLTVAYFKSVYKIFPAIATGTSS